MTLPHVNREKKNDFSFYGGSNWCSVTYEYAKYLINEYKRIRRSYYFTQISDESILQTVLMKSLYKNSVYQSSFSNSCISNVREIDWNRGNPYVFHTEDFELLMNSPCMFARKFDEKTDRKIIEQIYETINNEQIKDRG